MHSYRGATLLTCFAWLQLLSFAPEARAAGEVGAWNFDGVPAAVVPDTSGHGLNGTVKGHAAFSTGKLHQALLLGGVDGRLELAPDPFSQLTHDLSFSVWIKTTNHVRTEAILSRYSAAASECGYLLRSTREGFLELRLGGCHTGGTARTFTAARYPINDGQWHHVAATVGLGKGVGLYVDGIPAFAATLEVIPATAAQPLTVGATSYPPMGEPFAGAVDQITLFDHVLVGADIQILLNPAAQSRTPVASLSSDNLNFQTAKDAVSPVRQTVQLRFSQGSPAWTIRSDQAWLKISSASGAGATSLAVNPASAGLGPGIYAGTITVSAPSATPPLLRIGVKLEISATNLPRTGESFYVSPEGTPFGDGSINRTWDIKTALGHPDSVKPGDVIWLKGGVYGSGTVVFPSTLTGTAAKPILFKQYTNERAIINGGLSVSGGHTWYWGFEVANLSATTRSEANTGSLNTLKLPNGFDVYAPGSKFVNLVIHDTAQGIGLWTPAVDAEIYGCVIFNNGWQGLDRGHGHGIYTQNQTGTKSIQDNILFQGFGLGIQAYGSEAAYVENYLFVGNTIFNSGVLSRSQHHDYNLLVAGGHRPKNITVQGNYTYHTPADHDGLSALDWPDTDASSNLIATDNYWIGGNAALWLANWTSATFTGNVTYSDGLTLQASNLTPSKYQWDNNRYFGGIVSLDSRNRTFAQWQTMTGLDSHSTFSSSRPKGIWSFVRPNKFEPGRANITIYNWDLASTVPVDLTGTLTIGSRYEIRNAQDYNGPPVLAGTFTGGKVSIPMSGLKVAPPIGLVPSMPKSTGPEFGVFVLLRR